ncbi:hypothetical protein HBB16_10210 [Pseudonocardia sp. MCCB 268]|nr:hypothetical protein [Pseudonocardia cytotoxica]
MGPSTGSPAGTFLDEIRPGRAALIRRRRDGRQAFVDHLNLVDILARLPYLDPGLPESLPPRLAGPGGRRAVRPASNGRLEPPAGTLEP